MRKYLAPLPLILVPAFLLACRQEATGLLEASQTGDLSNPTATRADADAELIEACGKPASPDGGDSLRRQPYLQQLGTTSTHVLWSSARGNSSPYLEVATPDGEVVDTIEASKGASNGLQNAASWAVKVDGLEPDNIYCYSIFNGPDDALIEHVGFRTAPTQDSGAPARFIVLGDSGEGSEDQYALLEQLPTVPFDFMLHVGDMAYDSGTFAEFDKNFFQVYESLMKNFAVFPVPGNHEYETDDAGPYRAVFDLPNNERWYSFDWGPVHFAAIDTEQIGDKQANWLKEDLAKSNQPWKIAFMHKPPYSSGSHGSEKAARRAFSPIFEKYGVSLVLTGHDHHYERTKPQNGVYYIVSGGGGASTYAVSESDFTAFAEQVIEFLYITADESQLSVHAIDGTGQEFDQLVISK